MTQSWGVSALKLRQRAFDDISLSELTLIMKQTRQRKYHMLGVAFRVEELDSGKFNLILEYWS